MGFASERLEWKQEKIRQEELKAIGADTGDLTENRMKMYGFGLLALAGGIVIFGFMLTFMNQSRQQTNQRIKN